MFSTNYFNDLPENLQNHIMNICKYGELEKCRRNYLIINKVLSKNKSTLHELNLNWIRMFEEHSFRLKSSSSHSKNPMISYLPSRFVGNYDNYMIFVHHCDSNYEKYNKYLIKSCESHHYYIDLSPELFKIYDRHYLEKNWDSHVINCVSNMIKFDHYIARQVCRHKCCDKLTTLLCGYCKEHSQSFDEIVNSL